MSTFNPNIEPPVMADDFDAQPGWPKPVGIISIVWGSIGLLCGVCGVGGSAMTPTFMKGMEEQMGGPMPEVMKPSVAQMGLMGLSLIPAVLLIAAGVMTVKRNFNGRMLHLVYVGLAIVFGAMGIAMQVMQQMAQKDWAAQNPESKWAQQIQQGAAFAIPAIGCAVVLSFAWPIFCAIWFGFVKTKKSDFGEVRSDYI